MSDFRSRPPSARLRLFRTVRDGLPWFVAVAGEYRTRDEARAAVLALPEGLRELGPWPRSLADIQAEIRRRPD